MDIFYEKKIRIAIVGTGYFSQFHYDAWKRLEVSVVAICSLNKNEALYFLRSLIIAPFIIILKK